ncbi:hypothetical protein ACTFIZ_010929 [Dictyostelium cf. discoideum]
MNPDILEHKNEDWEFIKNLGPNKEVHKKKNGHINGVNVSLCVIKKMELKELCFSEVDILNKLKDCEYSTKYYGYAFDKKNNLNIYMEYIDGAITINEKLDQIKGENKKYLPLDIIKLLTIKIADALSKIHELGIIHRDIRGSNILLLEKGNQIQIKFIGFENAMQIENNSKFYSRVGTATHMAPEVKLQDGNAGRKSDVFSLGCTIIEMAGGDLNCTTDRDPNGIPSIPVHLPAELKIITQNCLHFNPKARFSTDDLISHINKKNVDKEYFYSPFGYIIPSNIKMLEYGDSGGGGGGGGGGVHPLTTGSIGDINYLSLPFYNEIIQVGLIPSSVKYLLFKKLNQKIECGSVPESVEYLDLGDKFDIVKNGIDLPNDTISVLRCGFNFEIPINLRSLPNSITDLQLYNYNINILKNSFPSNVSSLTLGSNFNSFESLKNLSVCVKNLKSLTFSFQETTLETEQLITQIINNFIPNTIISVIINGKQRR